VRNCFGFRTRSLNICSKSLCQFWSLYFDAKRSDGTDQQSKHQKGLGLEEKDNDGAKETPNTEKSMSQQHPKFYFFRVVDHQDADVEHYF
jgi:hypothetical protein